MSILHRLKSTKSIKTISDQKVPEIEEFPLNSSEYKIIGIVGKGAFSHVYGAECTSKKNKKVAIKVIKLETDELDGYHDDDDIKNLSIEEIQQEAAIMKSLRHQNVVLLYASFVAYHELWLIMPFISGGSISHILLHSKNDLFRHGIKDESIICCILRDILLGLNYIHNQQRIHRDIKGGNILIDGTNGAARLADFGVSGALLENGLKKRSRNTQTGTPCWMAPEVMRHQQYNVKADIWSLGITALELAFGTTPYTKFRSAMKIQMEILDGPEPTVDGMSKNHSFSKSFKQFVSKCCVKDPSRRLSAMELLGTEFIHKYAKDQRFMIDNFVPHLFKTKLRQCAKRDLPLSLQTKQSIGSDHGMEELSFSFGTDCSSTDEDIADPMEDQVEQVKCVKKSKFTVKTVEDDDVKTEPKKKSRFTVTTAAD
eukprot:555824_1